MIWYNLEEHHQQSEEYAAAKEQMMHHLESTEAGVKVESNLCAFHFDKIFIFYIGGRYPNRAASWEAHLGQFLQDGKNDCFVSFFLKRRASVKPNLIR